MSRIFFKLHYDLLQNPAYRSFMQMPANVTYTLLLARVFRPTKDMPRDQDTREMLNLYNERWLCCRVSTRELNREYPERHWTSIARDIRWLEEQGLVEVYVWEKNTAPLLKLGSWADYRHPDGRKQRIETFFIDRVFALDSEL